MDHGNAQSTFVELAFGINILFAAYEHFRKRIFKEIENRIEEKITEAKVIEVRADGQRVDRVTHHLVALSQKHIKWQIRLTDGTCKVALFASVLCVCVAYFDLFECIGFLNGLLILPLPTFVLLSVINFKRFKSDADTLIEDYKKLVDMFEPVASIPQPPTEPPQENSDSN